MQNAFIRRAVALGIMLMSLLLMSCDQILGIHDVTLNPSAVPSGDFRGIGMFVSGFAHGEQGSIKLDGQILWHASVHGSQGGITLDGVLE